MARDGMTDMIGLVRQYCVLSASDYDIAGSTYWSDNEIQRHLDQTRLQRNRFPLTPISSYESGTLVYKSYMIPDDFVEQGTTAFELEDVYGNTVSTANYTVDYTRHTITFTDSTLGSIMLANYSAFDLNRTAARIWRIKMAHVASDAFDIKLDNQQLKRSDIMDNYRSMAEYFETKAGKGGITVIKTYRDDILTW